MFDGATPDDVDLWSARNQRWISATKQAAKKRGRRERQKEPLILCGHGVSIRVDGGTLLIRNGLTHYPQRREEFRFFKGDPAVPLRIILLDGSGCISFDVLDWLAEQGVALVRIDWKGEVASVFAASGFTADPAKVRWQVETRADPPRRMAFATRLIAEKIANSIRTLETVIPPTRSRDVAILRLRREHDGLAARQPETVPNLLGIEGRAAAAYFKAWEDVTLRWKRMARRPIPESWHAIGPRSAARNAGKAKNVRASHPMNAMLNYAYAVLQSQIQIEAVAGGYNPTLGIMHHGYHGSPALVFDLMEPSRPKVDAAVLAFALAETLAADFLMRSDGVVRLAPQLARQICQLGGLTPKRANSLFGYDGSQQLD